MISRKGHCHQVLLNVFLNGFEQDKPNTMFHYFPEKADISMADISKTHAKQVSWINSSTGERKKYIFPLRINIQPCSFLQLSIFNQTRNKTITCLSSIHQMKKKTNSQWDTPFLQWDLDKFLITSIINLPYLNLLEQLRLRSGLWPGQGFFCCKWSEYQAARYHQAQKSTSFQRRVWKPTCAAL